VVVKQGSDASRGNLAAALIMLGEMALEVDRDMAAALAHTRAALALWEEIDRGPKGDEKGEGIKPKEEVKAALADLNMRVGVLCLRAGRPEEADRHFTRVLELQRERLADAAAGPRADPGLVAARKLDVAFALFARAQAGEGEAVRPFFEEALPLVEEVLTRFPKATTARESALRASLLGGDHYLRSDPPTAGRWATPTTRWACSWRVRESPPRPVPTSWRAGRRGSSSPSRTARTTSGRWS
jgi:hypothetical protein